MSRHRLIIALLLGVVPAGACRSDSSPPKVVAGAPAGDVRAVRGTVTAKRGEAAARPLASGDEVSADDVVTTGADSEVVIELRHNGVRWSLGPGQEKAVSASVAWKAAKPGGGTGGTDRNTAAGRHAERTAADTGADPAPPEVEEEPKGDEEGDEESGGTGTAMALDEGKMGKKDSARAEGQYKLRATAPLLKFALAEAAGPIAVDELASRISAIQCWDAPRDGAVAVTVTIAPDGRVANVVIDPEAAGLARCLADGLRAAMFSAADAESTLSGTVRAMP